MTKVLSRTYENVVFVRQIIRSATSIGANIEEGLGANSKKDFIHCMNIAKKEARETHYWLRLMEQVNSNTNFTTLLQENQELIVMLTSIVKTADGKLRTHNL